MPSHLLADIQYDVVLLTPRPARPNAINSQGQVVGYYEAEQGVRHAFLWQDGILTDLGTLEADSQSEAVDISNQGVVVGNSFTENIVDNRMFVWENGSMTELDVGQMGSMPVNYASGINDSGHVIGTADGVVGGNLVFLYRNGETIPLAAAANWPSLSGINNSVQIAGTDFNISDSRPFVWHDGAFDYLNLLGGKSGFAYGINEEGHVTGSSSLDSSDQTAYHACLWVDGAVTDLGTLTGENSRSNSLNDRGEVVGCADVNESYPGVTEHAFIWKNDSLYDLNNLISTDGGDTGWILLEAADINDAGYIVGIGRYTGAQNAFLLRPLDTYVGHEPARGGTNHGWSVHLVRSSGPGGFDIRYTVPEAGDVTVSVLDARGRLLCVLYNGYAGAGEHVLRCRRPFGSGVYLVRIAVGVGAARRTESAPPRLLSVVR
jgi:probable HAF family extracellular repeat protein